MVYLWESNFLFFPQFCFQILSFLPNLKSDVANKIEQIFSSFSFPFIVSFLDLQIINSDLLSHPYSPPEFWSNYKTNGLSLKHILYLSTYYNLLKKSPNEIGVSQKYAGFYLPCSHCYIIRALMLFSINQESVSFKKICAFLQHILLVGRLNL